MCSRVFHGQLLPPHHHPPSTTIHAHPLTSIRTRRSYRIHVLLHNRDHVADSPYTMHASSPTPSAPLCLVRGPALFKAIARQQETFEVLFKDVHGHVAQSEELDVYAMLRVAASRVGGCAAHL